MKHDIALLKLSIEDERDRKITEQLIKENYALIRDLYYFVLEKSVDFPILTPETLYNEFFTLLQLKKNGYTIPRQQYDFTVKCVNKDSRIRRFEFIEFLVNVSLLQRTQDQTSS
jgi:hypothetical protein